MDSLKDFFLLLRTHQWTKNCFCLGGVLFSGKFLDSHWILLALGVLGVFCLGSSSVYVLNDIIDRNHDRQHPKKKNRPIAKRTLTIQSALFIFSVLLTAAIVTATLLRISALLCLFAYIGNNIAYCFYFKKIPILDILSIALGFVIRLMAGILIVEEAPTLWILLCAFFLALFLGFSKRYSEFIQTKGKSYQRSVLKKYSKPLLLLLLNFSAYMAIIAYGLFTLLSHRSDYLWITILFVLFAILYYKRKVLRNEFGEEPDQIVLKDIYLQTTIVAWLLLYIYIVFIK